MKKRGVRKLKQCLDFRGEGAQAIKAVLHEVFEAHARDMKEWHMHKLADLCGQTMVGIRNFMITQFRKRFKGETAGWEPKKRKKSSKPSRIPLDREKGLGCSRCRYAANGCNTCGCYPGNGNGRPAKRPRPGPHQKPAAARKRFARMGKKGKNCVTEILPLGVWWRKHDEDFSVGQFYYGVTSEYDEDQGKHLIYYKDGDVKWHDLRHEAVDLSTSFPRESFGERGWLGFEEARDFVCLLRFQSVPDFKDWLQSEYRPECIPTRPKLTYKDCGFTTYEAFIGITIQSLGELSLKTGKLVPSLPTLPKASGRFRRLRTYAQTLALKTPHAWFTLYDQGKLRKGCSRDPSVEFREEGFSTWSDFLGDGKKWSSYYCAKEFASGLQLSSEKEWYAYCQCMKMPETIPSNPKDVYTREWISWGDFLSQSPFINREVWTRAMQPDEEEEEEEEGEEGVTVRFSVPKFRTATGGKGLRFNRFKPIPRSQRCGHCHTCLNPKLKQSCLTVRAQQQDMERERLRASKEKKEGKKNAKPKHKRCGKCFNCVNPQRKQRCLNPIYL